MENQNTTPNDPLNQNNNLPPETASLNNNVNAPSPTTPTVMGSLSGASPNQAFVSSPMGGSTFEQPKKSKKLLILIPSIIVVLIIGIAVSLLALHKPPSKAPPTKSVVSTTTKPPATKTVTPSCPAVSGVALCSYAAQINSVDVAAVQVSTLFLQNATTNLDPNATELETTTSELRLDYLANPATSVVQPCTSDPSSWGPELFSYTSNGTTQVACGGKSTGDNGYAYTYGSIVNINGMDYGIALFSQSPITNPVVEAIFTSVKPS